MTQAQVCDRIADHWTGRAEKPFAAIVIDEAQDLAPPALRMLAALASEGLDSLFLAGDQGQRIFQEAFSWKTLGIDIRGRSRVLKVNYRTSHQIRSAADRLLPDAMTDADGNEEQRSATVSVFNGPDPIVHIATDAASEGEAVAGAIRRWRDEGICAGEIGIFVRSTGEIDRARRAVEAAQQTWHDLASRRERTDDCVAVGTMNLAKGMEFRAVVIMACDEGILPDDERLMDIVDPADIEEIYETERRLLYVAATRARYALFVTGIMPGSVFLADFGAQTSSVSN